MRRLFLSVCLMLVVCASNAASPKYIFYFIGDGMGLPIINATEHFTAFNSGLEGNSRLQFTTLPALGIATSFCSGRYITDSAAAGTALATAHKTSPGTIGMDATHTAPVYSVAKRAKDAGLAVGIITTVSIDHATPASFYAHQPKRTMHYEIACDGVTADFDLYGGSGFLEPIKGENNVYTTYSNAGYQRISGKSELNRLDTLTSKALITECSGVSTESLALSIDRTESDMALSDMLGASIDYLYKRGGNKGFFIMAEGGMVDWAAHSNDAGSAIGEVLDLDESVKIAYEFYLQHPEETLIIVTADHETGGFSLGNGNRSYDLSMEYVAAQKCSKGALEKALEATSKWKEAQTVLSENLGFGSTVPLTAKEEAALEAQYAAKPSKLANVALELLNKKAGIGWTSGTHTGLPVMIFAIGANSNLLAGNHDNTDIPKTIDKFISK